MGLKQGPIGKTLEEHIGNLMGTHWELEGNMLGTKEKRENILPYFIWWVQMLGTCTVVVVA